MCSSFRRCSTRPNGCIRAALAAIGSLQRQGGANEHTCWVSLLDACGRALTEIAAALEEGRDPTR